MRVLLSCFMAIMLIAGQVMAMEKKVELKTDNQKLSYVVGLDLGLYLKKLNENFELNILHQGVVDSYKGNIPALNSEEVTEIRQQFMLKQKNRQDK